MIFVDFEDFYAIHSILAEKQWQNGSWLYFVGSYGSFETPGTPGGQLSTGDI